MDIETGILSVGRHSAEKQFNSYIMLDGIKMEDHPLRSGQATLGVMLGEFRSAAGSRPTDGSGSCLGLLSDILPTKLRKCIDYRLMSPGQGMRHAIYKPSPNMGYITHLCCSLNCLAKQYNNRLIRIGWSSVK